MDEMLRPVERRVLQLRRDGDSIDEIGRKIAKSPDHVERLIALTAIPRSRPPFRRRPSPLERRVMAMRAEGEGYDEIARRLRRRVASVRQIEGLAHFGQALALLARERRSAPPLPTWGSPATAEPGGG